MWVMKLRAPYSRDRFSSVRQFVSANQKKCLSSIAHHIHTHTRSLVHLCCCHKISTTIQHSSCWAREEAAARAQSEQIRSAHRELEHTTTTARILPWIHYFSPHIILCSLFSLLSCSLHSHLHQQLWCFYIKIFLFSSSPPPPTPHMTWMKWTKRARDSWRSSE